MVYDQICIIMPMKTSGKISTYKAKKGFLW